MEVLAVLLASVVVAFFLGRASVRPKRNDDFLRGWHLAWEVAERQRREGV